LEKLPVDDALRERLRGVLSADDSDPEAVRALARELADTMRAPVVYGDEVYRPAPLP
jgi:hypothetical protein